MDSWTKDGDHEFRTEEARVRYNHYRSRAKLFAFMGRYIALPSAAGVTLYLFGLPFLHMILNPSTPPPSSFETKLDLTFILSIGVWPVFPLEYFKGKLWGIHESDDVRCFGDHRTKAERKKDAKTEEDGPTSNPFIQAPEVKI